MTLDPRTPWSRRCIRDGLDHGVGHPLLLLCGAKVSNYRKNKEFNDLGHYSEWPKVADAVIKASGTPNRRHPALIFPPEFGRTNSNINDGFIDQHLFTADRAAIEVFLRRRAKGFVQAFRRD